MWILKKTKTRKPKSEAAMRAIEVRGGAWDGRSGIDGVGDMVEREDGA